MGTIEIKERALIDFGKDKPSKNIFVMHPTEGNIGSLLITDNIMRCKVFGEHKVPKKVNVEFGIQFVFHNTKSIEAVISALEKVKQKGGKVNENTK